MSYHIKQDESVQHGVRRVARDQVDKAIEEIEDSSIDQPETVHQVRKRCKKLRGLIRLVRPAFEETYQQENAWYRDTARQISYVRDAQSVAKTFDDLLDAFNDQIDRDALASIGKQLYSRRDEIYGQTEEIDQRLGAVMVRLREGRDRIDTWMLEDDGRDGFDAVAAGLGKTFGRGHAAMATAYDTPSTETFHDWRKRVKYHWYHARLLRSIWSNMMQPYAKEAHALSDYLGNEHDLAVLRQMLHDEPDAYGDAATLQACMGLIDRRRTALRAQARPLGLRIFCEKPKRFVKRMGCYWHARHCTPDPLD